MATGAAQGAAAIGPATKGLATMGLATMGLATRRSPHSEVSKAKSARPSQQGGVGMRDIIDASSSSPAAQGAAAPGDATAVVSAQARQMIGSLRYDRNGLIPAIAQCVETGEVLMLAWMSPVSIERSLTEGRAVYWSRSRQDFWRKGDSSGHIQELIEMRVDCDGDTLLLRVRQTGAACHTGRRSCFFRPIDGEGVQEPVDDGAPSGAAP